MSKYIGCPTCGRDSIPRSFRYNQCPECMDENLRMYEDVRG